MKSFGRFANPVIALDIGNVSMKLTFDEMYSGIGASPDDSAHWTPFSNFWYDYEHGTIGTSEFLRRLDEYTAHRYSPDELYRRWACGVSEPMPGMADFVRTLAERGVRFSFMSDIAPVHLEQTLRYCGFAPYMTGGTFSFQAGAFKMEGSAMFDAFEKRYGRPVIYFDDRLDIITHARELGWNAVQFRNAAQCLADSEAVLETLA